jgi:hypothetical protein
MNDPAYTADEWMRDEAYIEGYSDGRKSAVFNDGGTWDDEIDSYRMGYYDAKGDHLFPHQELERVVLKDGREVMQITSHSVPAWGLSNE